TWVDRRGGEERINAPPRAYVAPRISPDGTRVALDIRDQENDIWIWDLARKTMTRLTIDPGLNRGVAWSPDGTRVAFSSTRNGAENVFWQAADGTGVQEPLTEGSGVRVPSAFTPDGQHLIFIEPATPPHDLGIIDVAGPTASRKREPLLRASYSETNGEVSPDGKWLAYQSNESGQRDEIY